MWAKKCNKCVMAHLVLLRLVSLRDLIKLIAALLRRNELLHHDNLIFHMMPMHYKKPTIFRSCSSLMNAFEFADLLAVKFFLFYMFLLKFVLCLFLLTFLILGFFNPTLFAKIFLFINLSISS